MTTKKHEKVRKVLMDYGCDEFGDNIIDDICKIFNYPTTTEDISFSTEELQKFREGLHEDLDRKIEEGIIKFGSDRDE